MLSGKTSTVNKSKASDEELARLYIETQRNTYFEQLYARYCDKVYRKCLSFTKDPVQAEDLTHDIFLKLVVKMGSFREEAKFSTWIYSITYNHCTDLHRARRPDREVHLDEEWDRLEVAGSDDMAELAEMEARQLEKALRQLEPDEQTLLLMKYQDDVSIRDIAIANDISESAVKMRLKRSRDKLRKHYLEGAVFWLLVVVKAIMTVRWPFR